MLHLGSKPTRARRSNLLVRFLTQGITKDPSSNRKNCPFSCPMMRYSFLSTSSGHWQPDRLLNSTVSLFQVGFFLFDYLLYFYVIGDPGLFSKVAFVQQKHFAYKSWNALRSKLVWIRLFFNFPCCNHYMMTTLLITTLLWCKIALKFRKLWIPWTSLKCYYGTLKKLTNQVWRDFFVN